MGQRAAHTRRHPTTGTVHHVRAATVRDRPRTAVEDTTVERLTSQATEPPTGGSLDDFDQDTPVDQIEFAVLDVETSGLNWAEGGRVIEFAVVTVKGDGTETGRWSTLVKPADGLAGATDIHGITDQDLENAPSFAQVAPTIAEHLQGRVVTAHNAPFDMRMLDNEFGAAGWDLPEQATLDTLSLAADPPADENGDRPEHFQSRSLGFLAEHFDIPLHDAHRAGDDAGACAQLLPHLLDRHQIRTVADLTGSKATSRSGLDTYRQPEDPIVQATNAATYEPHPDPYSPDGLNVYDNLGRQADVIDTVSKTRLRWNTIAPIIVPAASTRTGYWRQHWGLFREQPDGQSHLVAWAEPSSRGGCQIVVGTPPDSEDGRTWQPTPPMSHPTNTLGP